MAKPKKATRIDEVKEYLRSIGVEFQPDVPYGNGLGTTIPLQGKYAGALVNCFTTGTVNVQGGGDNLDEIKALIDRKFSSK